MTAQLFAPNKADCARVLARRARGAHLGRQAGRQDDARRGEVRDEIPDGKLNLVDELFAGRAPQATGAPVGRRAFGSVIAAGGYPEARLRAAGSSRERWFASYIDTALERDLREIADARRADDMSRLLRLVASQSANLLSYRAVPARSPRSRSRPPHRCVPATGSGSSPCAKLGETSSRAASLSTRAGRPSRLETGSGQSRMRACGHSESSKRPTRASPSSAARAPGAPLPPRLPRQRPARAARSTSRARRSRPPRRRCRPPGTSASPRGESTRA